MNVLTGVDNSESLLQIAGLDRHKAVLFIQPNEWDRPIIKDLKALGFSIYSVVTADPLRTEPVFKSSDLTENIVYNNALERKTMLVDFKFQIAEYSKIIKNRQIQIIIPNNSISDFLVISRLSRLFNLPGLNKEQERFWCRKSRYLKYFRSLGVNTPRIYQIVPMKGYPDYSTIPDFPVICKPDCGNGGDGVFLARSSKELIAFFAPAPENEIVDEIRKQYRSKDEFGQMRNYLYGFQQSNFLIEEFISGPVLSIAGIKAVNGIEISLIYKIKPSDPPFRAENEFTAPFTDKSGRITEKLSSLIMHITKDGTFPYGPFMLDIILDRDESFWLIDAAPRFSSTATQFFKPCYSDDSYVKRSIQALLNQTVPLQERGAPVMYCYSKRLPLQKGRLIGFSQEEPFSDCVIDWSLPLKVGDQITRERTDYLSSKRGFITVTGKTALSAKTGWLKEFKKLNFQIMCDLSPIY